MGTSLDQQHVACEALDARTSTGGSGVGDCLRGILMAVELAHRGLNMAKSSERAGYLP